MLLPTTLVGSYAQPEWLIDRAKLASRFPPRVRAKELWRIPEPYLAEAQDDATVLAIRAQEEAGLDIITDGEFAAKAIRTGSRPRSKASTSTGRASRSTGLAILIRFRALSARSAASMPSRLTTSSSCARIRRATSK